MGITDLIASFLQDSLETAEDGVLEVQRSDLAQRFNCVPSQINYVMSTRFSPERGYIVESRRLYCGVIFEGTPAHSGSTPVGSEPVSEYPPLRRPASLAAPVPTPCRLQR